MKSKILAALLVAFCGVALAGTAVLTPTTLNPIPIAERIANSVHQTLSADGIAVANAATAAAGAADLALNDQQAAAIALAAGQVWEATSIAGRFAANIADAAVVAAGSILAAVEAGQRATIAARTEAFARATQGEGLTAALVRNRGEQVANATATQIAYGAGSAAAWATVLALTPEGPGTA
eukprot:tig00020904_g15217.t1